MKKTLLITLSSIILGLFPNLSYGQNPALGLTETFVIFTAAGGIDITGTSTIWGGCRKQRWCL